MSEIKALINSIRAMELPKGAESLLSSIGEKAGALERDRDDLKEKVQTRQEENDKFLKRAQDAESERDSLKEKVPGDGSTVLSKADAERWRVLSSLAGELGGVDKVQAKVARASELETKEAKRERRETLKKQGFNPAVFDAISEGNPYRIEEQGEQKTVYLTVGDEEVELTAYAEKVDRADLLNYLALETEPKPNGVPAAAQAGRREAGRVATVEEVAAEKRKRIRF